MMRRRRGALWCVVGLSLLANTHAAFHTRPPLLRLRRSERLPLMQLPKLKLPKLQPLEAAVEPLEAAVEARTAAHDEGAILFNRADHVFTQIDTSNDGFLRKKHKKSPQRPFFPHMWRPHFSHMSEKNALFSALFFSAHARSLKRSACWAFATCPSRRCARSSAASTTTTTGGSGARSSHACSGSP